MPDSRRRGIDIRAKQSIPDGQDRSVVAVGLCPQRRMVHGVHGGRDDKPAQPTVQRRRKA